MVTSGEQSTEWLAARLAAIAPDLLPSGKDIKDLRRLSGGASHETWAFAVLSENQTQSLILRRAPNGHQAASEAIGLKGEVSVIRAVTTTGAPTPEILYVCQPDDGLGEAYVMRAVVGETIARKILRDEAFAPIRHKLASQCGQALAHIHKAPISDLATLPISDGLDQLDRYKAIYDGLDLNRPVLEVAFQWCRAHAPAPLQSTLVHGDFRLGNLMIDDHGLACVLDWELAHIGDPREDLGWICVNSWRFGQREKPVGGFGDVPALLDGYETIAGIRFERADIAWFQALGSLKWAIMCQIMFASFASGPEPSIERAMIGRRTSEAEIDLLNIIEGKAYA